MTEPRARSAARAVLKRIVRARSALSRAALPRNDRDHALDPDTYALLTTMARKFDPRVAVGAVRHEYDTLGIVMDVPKRRLGHVEDRELKLAGHSVRVRFYQPRERRELGPGLVWLHGGGWVIGSLTSHDHALRELSYLADVPVIAVDYRLGPEHRFPAAHDDAFEAFVALTRDAATFGIDKDRLALGGDSAGGNLAVSTALRLKEARERLPAFLALVYPATEMIHRAPSRVTNGTGFFLTTELMDWFSDRYVRIPADKESPRLSVARASSYAGLPPTLVTTAGFDPLRDEGEILARRMREDGVTVEHRSEDRLIHGYMTMGGVLPEAYQGLRTIAVAVRSALAR